MERHRDGQPNMLAPEGPGSYGWQEYQAELAGQGEDPVSRKSKSDIQGEVTKEGKTSSYRVDSYDYDQDKDLSTRTSMRTKFATPEDKASFPSTSPDFVMTVNYYDNGDDQGRSDFRMKVPVNGDSTNAERLHDELFSTLIVSSNPYEGFRKFIEKHGLQYLNLDEEGDRAAEEQADLNTEELAELDTEYFQNYEEINPRPQSDLEATVTELQSEIGKLEDDLGYHQRADDYERGQDYLENYERYNSLPSRAERDAVDRPIRRAIVQGLRSLASWIEG